MSNYHEDRPFPWEHLRDQIVQLFAKHSVIISDTKELEEIIYDCKVVHAFECCDRTLHLANPEYQFKGFAKGQAQMHARVALDRQESIKI